MKLGLCNSICRPQYDAGFSPLSLSPALWLKADAGLYTTSGGSTAATADGDPVGRWEDQSGNGQHLLQATAGARPTLKLAIQNSRPVVRFDGSDDTMALAANLSFTIPFSVVWVVKVNSTGSYCLIAGNNGGSHGYKQKIESGKNVGGVDNVANYNTGAGSYGTAFHRGGARQAAGGNYDYRLDGAQDLAPTAPGATPSVGLNQIGKSPGSGEAFAGDMAEILVFSSYLSGANFTALEQYLADRWGVS